MKRGQNDNVLSWVDYVELELSDDYPEDFLTLVANAIGEDIEELQQYAEDLANIINFVETTGQWEHIMLVGERIVKGDVVLNFSKSFNIMDLKE